MLELVDNNNLDLIKELNSMSGFKISNGIYDKIYVYTLEEKIIGFINFSIIYDRAELNYIFVLDKYRKRGYGKKLMDFFIEKAKENNCFNITLEVKKSNTTAIKLYEKFMFKVIATRKNYYGNEDAVMMLKEV